eukprot:COSAG01_NODE_19398_length_1012_cov_1.013143_1_plen_198_part_00
MSLRTSMGVGGGGGPGYTPPVLDDPVDTAQDGSTSPRRPPPAEGGGVGVGEGDKSAGAAEYRESQASQDDYLRYISAMVSQQGGARSATVESCIVVLTFIALGGVLFYVQTVLVPLIMAVFVASMLVPMVDALTDRPLRVFQKTWCAPWCEPILRLQARHDNWCCDVFASVTTLRLPNVLGAAGSSPLCYVTALLLY